MTLERPVLASQVTAAAQIFNDRLTGAATAERALQRLAEVMPHHDQESVLVKVATLNQLYGTNVYAVVRMADHIVTVWTSNPDWTYGTVEEIADLPPAGEQRIARHHRSFASKFAHFFVDADRFPLLDSYAATMLRFHLGKGAPPAKTTLAYGTYADAFFRLRGESGLQCRVVELDKYLWLAGQHRTFAAGGKAANRLSPEVRTLFRSKDPLDRQLVAALVGEAGRSGGQRYLADPG